MARRKGPRVPASISGRPDARTAGRPDAQRTPPAPAASRINRRRARLVALVVVPAAILAAVVFGVLRHAAPAAPPGSSRLNVLLVTLDTTRADHIGCYGHASARTPTLDRLAAEGARFEQASSPAPITFAAHCSIFTGLYPFEHGARGNGDFYLTDRVATLATVLHKTGYRTAAFVSAFVLDRRYGLARGFDVYDDRLDTAAGAQVIDIEAERRGDRTVSALSAWLDAYARDRAAPFLVWLHLYDPHTPYAPPSPFREAFVDAPYDGEIAFDDALLGSLLDQLGRLGLRDQTLVVVVGDHGESLGDHGEETHSMFVYESAIRVPFIVWKPGLVPSGGVVREPVRLTDVAPSILELAGVPGLSTSSGRSLVADMRGARIAAPPVYSETLAPQLNMNWAPLRSVRDERWKLIDAPRPELYDLQQDPGELRNRATEQPQTLRALTGLLARVAGAGQGAMNRAPVDAATRSRLAALGYIGAGSGAQTRPGLASARDPKDFILLYNRLNKASRASRERRFSDALPILRDVLGKDPQNAFAQLTLGDVYLGLGEHAKAIEHYRAYLDLVPPTAYVHHLVAVCYLRLGQQQRAMQEAAAALAIDPRFSDARILRGTVFEERREYDAAVAEFRAATQTDPAKVMIRLDLAKVLIEAGRNEDAQSEYETILRQQPDFPPALADFGALCMKRGKLQEAETILARALALDPEQQEARFNLATIYQRQARTGEAVTEYRRVVDGKSTSPGLRRAATEHLRALGQR
jgi:arylsulfatase A-like enzyme/Tfp pilus assembly protein PilF